MTTQGIITFAYGSHEYIELAITLGQSLERFSPGVSRALVTDSNLKELGEWFDPIIRLRPEWGSDVSQKLHIDQYTPFDRTLFIDCDSLALGNLKFAFEMFDGEKACAIGTDFFEPGESIHEAELGEVAKTLGIGRMPKFNGGIYYLDKNGPQCTIIVRARELLRNYKNYGFKDFRQDGPADELLMAAAMAEAGILPIDDHGKLNADSNRIVWATTC